MKLSFRAKTMVALGVGASLFLTTAFADMLLSSGYDKLKASVKHTTKQLAEGVDSFTMESTYQVNVDDVPMYYEHAKDKYDFVNMKYERHNIEDIVSKPREYYSYRDRTQSVWSDHSTNKLYYSLYDEGHFEQFPQEIVSFDNFFEEEGTAELEKIVDAVVGTLQDLVIVEHSENGGYQYTGSLNDAQVPTLINAISSYLVKKEYNSQRSYQNADHLPELTSDLSIQSVTGEVLENDQGLISYITFEIKFGGKDAQGVAHTFDIGFEILITDINSTVIETPNLSEAIEYENVRENLITSKINLGTYSNNIVIKQDEQLIKIGERTLIIEDISTDSITGYLQEIVYEGYEDQYAPKKLTFTDIEVIGRIVSIGYIDDQGIENTAVAYMDSIDTIRFDPEVTVQQDGHGGYSYGSTSVKHFNNRFIKVFE